MHCLIVTMKCCLYSYQLLWGSPVHQ